MSKKKLENLVLEDVDKYRYIFKSAHLIIPGLEPEYIEPTSFSDISIIKDFNENLFCIFKVKLSCSPKTYYKIYENKDKILFNIRIDYYKVNGNTSNENDNITMTKRLFNDNFVAFLDDDEINNNPDLMEEADLVNKKDGTDKSLNDFGSTIDLFLFKENTIKSTKAIVNNVISSSTVMDAVAYILTKAGYKNVLLDTFENMETYDEIVLEPIPSIASIKNLEQKYAFYNTYAVIFSDFDTTYILNRYNKCGAWKRNERKRVNFKVVHDQDELSLLAGSSYIDDDDVYHIFISAKSIAFANDSVTGDILGGNNQISISNDGTIDSFDSSSKQRGTGNTQIVVNKSNNPYLTRAEAFNKKENSFKVAIEVADLDISLLTPNKEYVFSFTDQKMARERSGIYRLISVCNTFVKNGSFYNIISSLTFVSSSIKMKK